MPYVNFVIYVSWNHRAHNSNPDSFSHFTSRVYKFIELQNGTLKGGATTYCILTRRHIVYSRSESVRMIDYCALFFIFEYYRIKI